MDTVEEPIASSHIGESRTRTPAYSSFDSNTDKLLHLFKFISRGVKNFTDELKTTVDPKIVRLCAEIAALGEPQDKEANDQVTDREAREAESAFSAPRQSAEIAHEISDVLTNPVKQFTGGVLIIHQWIPVILVTIVEAYLKDVRIFEAKVNPAIMESSEQSVTYAEVVQSRSISDLTEEMRSRWACWMKRTAALRTAVVNARRP